MVRHLLTAPVIGFLLWGIMVTFVNSAASMKSCVSNSDCNLTDNQCLDCHKDYNRKNRTHNQCATTSAECGSCLPGFTLRSNGANCTADGEGESTATETYSSPSVWIIILIVLAGIAAAGICFVCIWVWLQVRAYSKESTTVFSDGNGYNGGDGGSTNRFSWGLDPVEEYFMEIVPNNLPEESIPLDVAGIGDDVEGIGDDVEGIGDDVEGIGDDVEGIGAVDEAMDDLEQAYLPEEAVPLDVAGIGGEIEGNGAVDEDIQANDAELLAHLQPVPAQVMDHGDEEPFEIENFSDYLTDDHIVPDSDDDSNLQRKIRIAVVDECLVETRYDILVASSE